VVAALEPAWAVIQQVHGDVPPAVMITGAGSIGGRGRLRLGHFAATRGRAGEDRELCEVFVGGEGLAGRASAVLATLLHEAAHALAHRGVKDTSRQGRHHNRRFKELAEELGLSVAHHPRLGWSPTTLPAAATVQYASGDPGLGPSDLPSPVAARMERAALGLSLGFAPRRPGAGQRTPGQGQAIEHGPGTTPQLTSSISNPVVLS
jgi:hypothetical protein